MSMSKGALDTARTVVAVGPGNAANRVRVSNGSGLLADPVPLPAARDGIGRLERLLGGECRC
jgi:hypothetical protein